MQQMGNCIFIKGVLVTRAECEILRKNHEVIEAKKAAEEAEGRAAAAKYAEENLRQAEAKQAADEAQRKAYQERESAYQKAKQEQQDAQWAADRARRDESERLRAEQYRLESEATAKADAAADRRANAAHAAQTATCGADYKAPRIGMHIDRVRACVTPVKVTAQLSRMDGVVTTYEGGNAYFHVMEGRVLSWGKY